MSYGSENFITLDETLSHTFLCQSLENSPFQENHYFFLLGLKRRTENISLYIAYC